MELNQFRNVDVVLDKANDNIIQKQFVSAGDKDGRSLTAQLTDNGVIGEIIGAAMNLYWHNQASGLTDLSAFSVVDRATSVFKIDYPQNMLTPGKVTAYIQILHGGKVTHTKPFEITVQNLAGTTRGVLATAEYGALVTTLAKANEFSAQLAQTENQINQLTDVKADKSEVNSLATAKADKISLQNTDNTVALKADKTYVDDQISNIGNASPKGTYATLSELQTAFPSGTVGVYVVAADGNWYYWDGSAWTVGGVYQSTGIADKSITSTKLADDWAIKSYLTTGQNVFSLTEEGNYLAYQATNCPTNDVLYHIEVRRGKTTPSNPAWIKFEATALNDNQYKYVAHVYGSTIRNWKLAGGIARPNSITVDMLTNTYRFRGFKSTVSINTFLDDGVYIATNTCTDFPPFDYWGITKHSSRVEVTRVNPSVIEQRLKTTNLLLAHQEFYRVTTNGSFAGVPWIPLHRTNLPLYNKNVVLLGDSMTEFGSQHVEIWKLTGANTSKLGFGGTRMAVHSNPYYAEFSFFKIAKAIKDNDLTTLIETADTMHDLGIDEYQDIVANLVAVDWTKVDYITVMYMYNDYAGANPIGTQGSYDTSTFIGAFNQGIKDILETYPHIKIYVFSEHWTDSTLFPDVDVNTNSLGLYFRDYVVALKEACEKLHIPFFDMFNNSGINKYTKSAYISIDGVHPNTKGYELIGLKKSNALVSK
ncbi:SGNH/GDSL hydrolase family protein [Enterococcus sp. DIV1314a]|uniref:SGNH/GDSL hydrolase family protein n=1 Tax=Enterococcus sp. DIV1314a TaxID=2774660 RepID=UPI003F25347C